MALAYAVRGSIYYMLRQFPEAKLSWEKALELDPSMDNVRAILYRM
jgi:tetratricopeptide (TPR) repeat protein